MPKMIVAKIDVTLIEKARLFKGSKPNKKDILPQYLDFILIETPNSPYGDYMIKQQVTQAERAAKLDMPILGNAKYLTGKRSEERKREEKPITPPPEEKNVPF